MIQRTIRRKYFTSVEKGGKIIETFIDDEEQLAQRKLYIKWKFGRDCAVEMRTIDIPQINYIEQADPSLGLDRRILRLSTGEVFGSIKQCSERTGITEVRLFALLNQNVEYTYIQ